MKKDKIFVNINKCRVCYSKNIKLVMNLGNHPSSNHLRDNLKEKLYKIPLKILHCSKCNTVQLSSTADPKYLFSKYVWVSATSETAKKYSKLFCDRLLKKTKNVSPFVFEIASNDGTFLKPFLKKKCKVLGIDPAKNIVKTAIKKGIPSIAGFFSDKISKEILIRNGKVDLIFARNVIPHVKEIHSILKGISSLLLTSGTLAIEFHYAKVIQDELHYDSIYHEHLFFFTIQTLSNLLEKYSLYPYDLDFSPISGGSIVLYSSKIKKEKSKRLKNMIFLEKKYNTNSFHKWKKFAKFCETHAKKLKQIVNNYSNEKKILAYGASARSSTLLNYSKIDNRLISEIIDKNPIKSNKFTPGTDIKIIPFLEGKKKLAKKNCCLLLAWNFRQEIIKEFKKMGFKGNVIIPLPKKINIYEVN